MAWNEKLQQLRGDKTIEEVSNDMGFSPNTYEAFEDGTREPFENLKKVIAEYFNVNVYDIWQ